MVYLSIISRSFAFLIITIVLNGFFALSIFSVAYELGVELTFPVGEATSGGWINTLANLIGFVVVMIMTPILDDADELDVMVCCIMFTAILLIALVILIFTNFKLKRT